MATQRMIALLLDRQPYGETLAAEVDFLRRSYAAPGVRPPPAHIAVVPPFQAELTDRALDHHVRQVCDAWDPFTVQLSGIGANYRGREMFVQVVRGAGELLDLHLALTSGPLARLRERDASYFPRVTVYRAEDQESFALAFRPLRERRFEGRFLARRLTVMQQTGEGWEPVEDLEFRPEPELG